MKIKLSIQERTNLKQLIENPRIGGGTSLGEIKSMLELVGKLEYKGDQEDPSTLTELSLEDSQVQRLHKSANSFNGWPVAQWVLDMKERLEKYNSAAK